MLGAVADDRLQKLIARAGLASRRKAEEWIVAGRVRVNGRVVATLGARADADSDRIEVDGRRLIFEAPVTYLLYKPREVVTTVADPEGRRTVIDLIRKVRRRVFPVGRLDFHTAGAILLTNDGDLANGLLRPRGLVPRVYRVKVKGAVSDEQVARLASGVDVDGKKLRATGAHRLGANADNSWLSVTVHQGPADPIARMFEAIGLRVMRLTRIAFAGVSVEGMRPGDYRQVDRRETSGLRRFAQLPNPRTRTLPPPPGWEESPSEDLRGEEDDGTWKAWEYGSVWELFEGDEAATSKPAVADAAVTDGVVRRAPSRERAGPTGRGPTEDAGLDDGGPAPWHGSLGGDFESDGWEEAGGTSPPPRRPPPERGPQRETPGRRPHAFRPGRPRDGGPGRDSRPARDSRPGRDERRSPGRVERPRKGGTARKPWEGGQRSPPRGRPRGGGGSGR